MPHMREPNPLNAATFTDMDEIADSASGNSRIVPVDPSEDLGNVNAFDAYGADSEGEWHLMPRSVQDGQDNWDQSPDQDVCLDEVMDFGGTIERAYRE